MNRSFRTLRKFLAPDWLTEGEGGLVGYALDIVKDAFLQRLYLGHLARFPATAPPDALISIGRDRRVTRGIFETEEQYIGRLLKWLDDRQSCGAAFALMQKLAEYTGPLPSFRTVDVRGNWYSRAADGTETSLLKQGNWDWDGEGATPRWSRFWVIIYPNGLWTEGQEWGDVSTQAWGEPGATWGSTATAEQVSKIRAIVDDWKPLHAQCVNVILAFDPTSFDPASPEPDGLWETWSKVVNGVRVPSRLSTARYWDGVL